MFGVHFIKFINRLAINL